MKDKNKLQGQNALVTGASSGIGAAIARALAEAGARVAVNYSSKEGPALQIVDEIHKMGGKAIAIKADVSKEKEVISMFDTMINELGTIDIMVSNAGIQKDSSFSEMTLAQWQRVIDINLTGAFLCAREAVKVFLKRGINTERSMAAGKIIFISSVHEVIPWARHANYAASKGGIMLLMKSLAQELAPKKIRVNSIGPGAIKTPINRSAWETPEAEAELVKLIPYKRVGEVEDIASAAVWLASDDSDYINGITLFVDGGMLLYPGFAHGG